MAGTHSSKTQTQKEKPTRRAAPPVSAEERCVRSACTASACGRSGCSVSRTRRKRAMLRPLVTLSVPVRAAPLNECVPNACPKGEAVPRHDTAVDFLAKLRLTTRREMPTQTQTCSLRAEKGLASPIQPSPCSRQRGRCPQPAACPPHGGPTWPHQPAGSGGEEARQCSEGAGTSLAFSCHLRMKVTQLLPMGAFESWVRRHSFCEGKGRGQEGRWPWGCSRPSPHHRPRGWCWQKPVWSQGSRGGRGAEEGPPTTASCRDGSGHGP